MCPRVQPFVLIAPPWPVAGARADTAIVTVSGFCPGPQAASFQVLIDFTPTGADTATVRFTVQNTSGVYAFQQPALGNPILTGMWFNLPAGAIVSYTEARLLAGAVLVSNGANLDGVPTAAGCTQLVSDVPETSWYTLVSGEAGGQYGLFTSGLGAAASRKAGLVDPGVFVSCRPQGSVFGSIVVAGRVRFTLQLANLPAWFHSAQDFLSLASTAPGEQPPWSFAGQVQGLKANGADGCFILKRALPVPTRVASERTWRMANRFKR